MGSLGSLGLPSRMVGEEDYIGAARTLRAMTDILGPVAALGLSYGAQVPTNIANPYNRMRNAVVLGSMQLLGEAMLFVEEQSTPVTFQQRWEQLGTRIQQYILPALCLPKLTSGLTMWVSPPYWSESVEAAGRDWPVTGDTARADRVVRDWQDTLPQVKPGWQWIRTARYGSSPVSLGADLKFPWLAALGWLAIGAMTASDIVTFFTETAEAGNATPRPDATPAVDNVERIRTRFERAFIPSVYQPVRAATKIAEDKGGDRTEMFGAMWRVNPYETEPVAPMVWDGTFGFGSSGPAASTSDSWFGPVLVGGAVALMMALLLGGD